MAGCDAPKLQLCSVLELLEHGGVQALVALRGGVQDVDRVLDLRLSTMKPALQQRPCIAMPSLGRCPRFSSGPCETTIVCKKRGSQAFLGLLVLEGASNFH